jgi:hypothetical protein
VDAATLGAIILPLVGVALGTAGTLTGQYLATRGESRRHSDQRTAALRAERKEAIARFLDAVQRVEQEIDNRRRGRPAEAEIGDLVHAMWLAKKLLELVSGADTANAAHFYAKALHGQLSGDRDDPSSAPERPLRGEFMEAARAELGVPGPRLYPTRADR